MTNRMGDVELDAKGMRALAHPARLAILQRLRAQGPSTATELAPHAGVSPSVASWHLRHLAEHGLVQDAAEQPGGRKRVWEAVGRGFRFEATEDPDAANVLTDVIEDADRDQVPRWRAQVRPRLSPQWRAVASRWNSVVSLTPDETAALERAWEETLSAYVQREEAGEAPADARPVRIIRMALPYGEVPRD
ncbi:helix-turn-helix domain-containing protein [Calidifontibacter sp. DB0510]|uniref:Helix-turn-helix domain-containing protein n=1 Tax=Metallococcus carri TaxID=1656884 RepID=A0A967B2W9_9MICO|nr:helix-turn-helix domain-containing protein [Metallococcus carri]NHN56994.1 helix-turn-helix domain-containing protein [Metallococcus carri]NOP37739.1 helix-turn-helix domain-containing protein [Calidifontibacter sp. DB2511S]